MDSKNISIYTLDSLLRSPKNQLLFLHFAGAADHTLEETIPISYGQGYRLALKILASLQESGYEEVRRLPEVAALLATVTAHQTSPAHATAAAKDEIKSSSPGATATKEASKKESHNSRRIGRVSLEEVATMEENASIASLKKTFTTGKPDTRLQVVRVLARRKDPDGVFLLLDGAHDEDVRVRRLATDALGYFPQEDVISTLLDQIRDDDKVVRQKAIESLAKIGDKSVAPALTDALNDPSVTIRRNVAEFLGSLGDSKLISVFTKVIKDEDESVRLSATKALVKIGGTVAASALAIAMKDTHAQVRENAAWALGEVGNPSVVPILIGALNFDEVAEVRQAAAEALGRLADPSSHKPLLRVLKDEEEEECVRTAAARALGKVGTFADVPILISLLRDPSHALRVQAVLTLGRIKDTSALPALEHVIVADPDPHVREAVAQALCDIGDRKSGTTLIKALRDKNGHVRAAAAKALAKLNVPEAFEALSMVREDSDDYARAHIAQAIEMLQKK